MRSRFRSARAQIFYRGHNRKGLMIPERLGRWVDYNRCHRRWRDSQSDPEPQILNPIILCLLSFLGAIFIRENSYEFVKFVVKFFHAEKSI
jgi:hypothetical protein